MVVGFFQPKISESDITVIKGALPEAAGRRDQPSMTMPWTRVILPEGGGGSAGFRPSTEVTLILAPSWLRRWLSRVDWRLTKTTRSPRFLRPRMSGMTFLTWPPKTGGGVNSD